MTTDYRLTLTSCGENKVAVIKVVKAALSLSLKDTKDLVEAAPSTILAQASKDEAERLRQQLEALGATVEVTAAGASSDTGRLYPTDTDDERLLNLIVVAKSRDRFRAMEIRKAQGVKAAIQFIGECTITDEPYDAETDEPTARDMLHEAWQTLFGIEKTAKMLYDTAGEDEAIGAARLIMISAEHAYTLIDDAKAKIEKDGAA